MRINGKEKGRENFIKVSPDFHKFSETFCFFLGGGGGGESKTLK